jgi:hypothetical protein
MMHPSRSKAYRKHLAWRRTRVLELSSKGLNEREIAKILELSQPTINRDITILKKQAKENISKYIDEQLPSEYHKCLIGITAIMKEAWTTATKAEQEGEIRDKLAALQLAQSCYNIKIDLLTNATVVDRALKFVNRHRGLVPQNTKVVIDDPIESVENIG